MKTETERLENTFDLVMLSDYYYESLVLLGQELCVQPHVLYVEPRMESKSYEKVPLSNTQMKTFRKYFAQDYYIYEHFKKIFDKKVKAFGRRKMEREVQKLKHMYEECNKNPKKCSFKSLPWIKNDSKEMYEVGTLASLLKLMKENKGFCPDGAQENLRNGKVSSCNGALDTIYAKDLYYDD